jgi:hypothetical protein
MARRRRELRIGLLAFVLAVPTAGEALAQTAAGRYGVESRRAASIAGRVIHPEGAAAEGARVAVYAVREGAPAAIVAMTTSRYDGRYEVSGLPAGTFMIGVTPRNASGFGGDLKRAPVMRIETFYPGTTERDRADPVTVFEAVPLEGVDVWLAPAAKRFSISGRIFWPESVDVQTVVIEYGGADGVRRGIWYVDDPGGLFTIEGAAQGTYVLLVRGETPAGPLIGLASTDVSIGPVEDVRVVLRSPGAIEGRVVTDATGRPQPPAFSVSSTQMLLTLSPLYPTEDSPVAGDGRFVLRHLAGEYALAVRGLPDGWQIKRIVHNGVALNSNRIVVPAGERVTGIEIVVGPAPRSIRRPAASWHLPCSNSGQLRS